MKLTALVGMRDATGRRLLLRFAVLLLIRITAVVYSTGDNRLLDTLHIYQQRTWTPHAAILSMLMGRTASW